MKTLPRIKQDEMESGLSCVSAIRPSKNMNDCRPVGGLQLTYTTERPDRDLAVADALGDVLGCGQQCLCPACRQELEQALDLVESGVDDTEETP